MELRLQKLPLPTRRVDAIRTPAAVDVGRIRIPQSNRLDPGTFRALALGAAGPGGILVVRRRIDRG